MGTPSDSELAQKYAVGLNGRTTAFFQGAWRRYQSGVWKPLHRYVQANEILQVLDITDDVRPTANKVHSVETLLRGKLFIPDEEIDADPTLINMANGVYRLEGGGKFIAHKPDFYLTTQLPFEYDSEADAPLWRMYLDSTFVHPLKVGEPPVSDPDLVAFVQEAVGYSLTTDNSHHSTFWCLGEGANGKGVLFHIISALAGDAAIPLNLGMLGREQYQLAQLAGKKVALCHETKRKNLLEDDLIKSLVGGDPMNVRMIRQEPFILNPVCKLWLSANNLPIVTDTSEGLWRRIMAIPFHQKFYNRREQKDNRILDLKERLERELPGIFNWALVGLQRLLERGKFQLAPQIRKLTDDYRHESNQVEMWLDEECYAIDNQSTAVNSLYANYTNWSQTNGFKRMSRTSFIGELRRLGYPPDRKTTRVEGLQLKVQGTMFP